MLTRAYALQRRFGFYYGDSTIWLRPAAFAALGGYRDLPIMDDYDLVRRMERASTPRACRAGVTSPRRWRAMGMPRTLVTWWVIRLLFVAGVPANRLARLYEGALRSRTGTALRAGIPRQVRWERAALGAAARSGRDSTAREMLVDLGTGTGALLAELALRDPRPRLAIGFDLSPAMLAQVPRTSCRLEGRDRERRRAAAAKRVGGRRDRRRICSICSARTSARRCWRRPGACWRREGGSCASHRHGRGG